MKTVTTLTMVSLSVILCACATGYKPIGMTGGYSELRLSDNTYKIHVSGNGYTSDNRASEIAMLRAADLTIQSGYERFSILSGGTISSVVGTTPLIANKFGNNVVVTGGDNIIAPASDMIIQMFKRSDPGFLQAIDAKLIYDQLHARYS